MTNSHHDVCPFIESPAPFPGEAPADNGAAGMVFDIREFTVHDGPGLRTTVFLKGCPLRCAWCHNPEGQKTCSEVLHSQAGDRVVGRKWNAGDLVRRLNRHADLFRASSGGVSFSGGEPLMQADFLADVIGRLDGIHVLVETSGHAPVASFEKVALQCSQIYFDLKLIDPRQHLRYTGMDNRLILTNLERLNELGIPFVVRVPLVPDVTDTEENLRAIARLLRGKTGLTRVDLLSYNRAAGGKYGACGMEFKPDWDETQPCRDGTSIFNDVGIYAKMF